MHHTAPAAGLPDYFSDPAFVALIQQFQAGLGERAGELAAAHAEGDHAAVRRHAHRLKGAAGGYACTLVARLAESVERLCGGTPKDAATDKAITNLIAACRVEAAGQAGAAEQSGAAAGGCEIA